MNDEQNISASNASTDKPEAQPINDLQAAEINSPVFRNGYPKSNFEFK